MGSLNVRIATRKRASRGIGLRADTLKGAVINRTTRAVRTFLEVATERTPKWSGEATQAWKVSFDSLPAQTGGYTENPLKTLKYEEGLWDSAAGGLNRKVVEREMSGFRAKVSALVKSGKVFQVYITNTAVHSRLWLGDDTTEAEVVLREVNRDFYNYSEIMTVAKGRLKGRVF